MASPEGNEDSILAASQVPEEGDDGGEGLLGPGEGDNDGDDLEGTPRPRAGASGEEAAAEANDMADEDAAEVQDYSKFAALVGSGSGGGKGRGADIGTAASGLSSSRSLAANNVRTGKPQISGQTIRRGEKDFEEHGTRAQRAALEQSRTVMEAVLSYTRVHLGDGPGDVLRGWYFPDAWKDEEEEGEGEYMTVVEARNANSSGRRFAHTRHRVVMVEVGRGNMLASVGAVPGRPAWVPGVPKEEQLAPRPGSDRVWLLPEEALFLVERGSMELWWPLRSLESILGLEKDKEQDEEKEEKEEKGIPLSLQAAYALLIGSEDPDSGQPPRGRVSLPAYQVYINLRRSGYYVLRAVNIGPQPPLDAPAQQQLSAQPASLWQWLTSLLWPSSPSTTAARSTAPPYGPLVRPGLYRSYQSIYTQLPVIQPHHHHHHLVTSQNSSNPFRITYHVWKAGGAANAASASASAKFSKTRPPPPDFYLAVADAHATGVPTLDQLADLLASVPHHPTTSAKPAENKKPRPAAKTGPGKQSARSTPPSAAGGAPFNMGAVYRRLKQGRRSVLVAVVDHGLVNYLRFSDGSFAAEPLWPRFDAVAAGRHTGGGGGRKGGGGKGGRDRKSGSSSKANNGEGR